jgi:hypothetical protein
VYIFILLYYIASSTHRETSQAPVTEAGFGSNSPGKSEISDNGHGYTTGHTPAPSSIMNFDDDYDEEVTAEDIVDSVVLSDDEEEEKLRSENPHNLPFVKCISTLLKCCCSLIADLPEFRKGAEIVTSKRKFYDDVVLQTASDLTRSRTEDMRKKVLVFFIVFLLSFISFCMFLWFGYILVFIYSYNHLYSILYPILRYPTLYPTLP